MNRTRRPQPGGLIPYYRLTWDKETQRHRESRLLRVSVTLWLFVLRTGVETFQVPWYEAAVGVKASGL